MAVLAYCWSGSGVTARANSTAYSLGARIVPTIADAGTYAFIGRWYVWECTKAGTSGATTPSWPVSVTADTTTLSDGTVTWTARRPGFSSGTTVDWAFATIYFKYANDSAAAAQAGTTNDDVYVHYTHQEDYSAALTSVAAVKVFSVNKDSSNALTPMGTNGWIGHSSASYTLTIGPANTNKRYIYGLTFRVAGTGASRIEISADKSHIVFEECLFWQGSSNAGAYVEMGSTTDTQPVTIDFVNCQFRFANASQFARFNHSKTNFYSCSLHSSTTVPTYLLTNRYNHAEVNMVGCDWSLLTTTLFTEAAGYDSVLRLAQCKLGSNMTVVGTRVSTTAAGTVVYLFDCSSGDTHTFFGYYDAYGSVVSDTGIYYTTGAAAQSWKIVTTANCSFYTPFTSPFVDFYNTGTSSITPRFEILRDGSTTAYQNDEVWAEFFVKTTSGSTQSTPYNDRMTLLGTPANQASGAGTAAWTGEAASAWSGKIDSGVAVTPAEVGAIRGRVVVGEPSITVYVDPQVRT